MKNRLKGSGSYLKNNKFLVYVEGFIVQRLKFIEN
jgi:hypothetical protein